MGRQSKAGKAVSSRHVCGERQRITFAEALHAATLNGAYATFEEHDKGSVEPGELADLMVLHEAVSLAGEPLSLHNGLDMNTLWGHSRLADPATA